MRNTSIELRTFKAKGGQTYLGIRYPRKGQKGKYHYRFFVQIPARRAVKELKGYATTKQVPSNGYEIVWDEE